MQKHRRLHRLNHPADAPAIREQEGHQENTALEESWEANEMLLALRKVVFTCTIEHYQAKELQPKLQAGF